MTPRLTDKRMQRVSGISWSAGRAGSVHDAAASESGVAAKQALYSRENAPMERIVKAWDATSNATVVAGGTSNPR